MTRFISFVKFLPNLAVKEFLLSGVDSPPLREIRINDDVGSLTQFLI